jgi:hypothetical protein
MRKAICGTCATSGAILKSQIWISSARKHIVNYFDTSEDGGFYYERWGDAPVHTLAAAMLLKPEQLHHFSDVG